MDRIDEGAPLTLVHGPSGFAKTTLAVQWVERYAAAGGLTIWVSLRNRIQSVAAMWQTLADGMAFARVNRFSPAVCARATGWLAAFSPRTSSVVILSEREHIVLGHLAAGMTLSEIAAFLVVSPNTVKTQISSVYKKLGVTSRDDAVTMAHELGILTAAQ